MAVTTLLLAGILAAQLWSDPARVVAELQAAIRADPMKESNYTDLGNVLLATQNFTEAIVVLEHARMRFPESAQAALSLGVAYYGARRFDDAVKTLIEASKLAPAVEQPVMFLGRMWENVGTREGEAVERFQAFVKANPRSALGHFLLGKATADEAELRRSIVLGEHPEARVELGSLFEKQNRLQAAALEFERAAAMAPRNPVPHYRLFRLYSRMGLSTKAAEQRALHEKYAAEEKAEADKRQGATKHLNLKVQKP